MTLYSSEKFSGTLGGDHTLRTTALDNYSDMAGKCELVFQSRSDARSNALFTSLKTLILHRKESRFLLFPRCFGKEQTIETHMVGMDHLYWNTNFFGLIWFIYLICGISRLPHLGFQSGLFPGVEVTWPHAASSETSNKCFTVGHEGRPPNKDTGGNIIQTHFIPLHLVLGNGGTWLKSEMTMSPRH